MEGKGREELKTNSLVFHIHRSKHGGTISRDRKTKSGRNQDIYFGMLGDLSSKGQVSHWIFRYELRGVAEGTRDRNVGTGKEPIPLTVEERCWQKTWQNRSYDT